MMRTRLWLRTRRFFPAMSALTFALFLAAGCGGGDGETSGTAGGTVAGTTAGGTVAGTTTGGTNAGTTAGTVAETTAGGTSAETTGGGTTSETIETTGPETTEATTSNLDCEAGVGDPIAERDVADNSLKATFYALNDVEDLGSCHLFIKYRGDTIDLNDTAVCQAVGSDAFNGSLPDFEFLLGDISGQASGDLVTGLVIKEGTDGTSFIDYEDPQSTPLGLGGDIGIAFWLQGGSEENVVTAIGGQLTYSCIQDGTGNVQKGEMEVFLPSIDIPMVAEGDVANNAVKGQAEMILSNADADEFINFGNGSALAKFKGNVLDMNYDAQECAGNGTSCVSAIGFTFTNAGTELIQFYIGDIFDDTAPIMIGLVLAARVRAGGSVSLDGNSALVVGWEHVADLFDNKDPAYESCDGTMSFLEGGGGRKSGERLIVDLDVTQIKASCGR